MTDFSTWFLDAVTRHAAWSGPIVGILAFLESLLVVGLFVPAIATMIAVGGLVGAGIVDPAPVLICAIVGAVLGDWVSFAIGRRMGPRIYRHRWLKRHRLAFAQARLFFRRYGFMSVLAGRFLGPVRSTVPVVAGVLNMRPSSFQAANVLSAILWVPALLAPGYFAGSSLAVLEMTVEDIASIALVVCVVSVLGGLAAIRLIGKPRRRQRQF